MFKIIDLLCSYCVVLFFLLFFFAWWFENKNSLFNQYGMDIQPEIICTAGVQGLQS